MLLLLLLLLLLLFTADVYAAGTPDQFYDKQTKLGEGGGGAVYLVKSKKDGVEWALKESALRNRCCFFFVIILHSVFDDAVCFWTATDCASSQGQLRLAVARAGDSCHERLAPPGSRADERGLPRQDLFVLNCCCCSLFWATDIDCCLLIIFL